MNTITYLHKHALISDMPTLLVVIANIYFILFWGSYNFFVCLFVFTQERITRCRQVYKNIKYKTQKSKNKNISPIKTNLQFVCEGLYEFTMCARPCTVMSISELHMRSHVIGKWTL